MFNKATIVGRVAKDPLVRDTKGGKVANVTVVTSQSFKNKDTGKYEDKSEFHNVTIFGDGSAGYVERNVNKGDLVIVEGKIETTSYEKDGVKKFATNIIVGGPSHQFQKIFVGASGGGGGVKNTHKGDDIPF